MVQLRIACRILEERPPLPVKNKGGGLQTRPCSLEEVKRRIGKMIGEMDPKRKKEKNRAFSEGMKKLVLVVMDDTLVNWAVLFFAYFLTSLIFLLLCSGERKGIARFCIGRWGGRRASISISISISICICIRRVVLFFFKGRFFWFGLVGWLV